jgi:hypothetical protein
MSDEIQRIGGENGINDNNPPPRPANSHHFPYDVGCLPITNVMEKPHAENAIKTIVAKSQTGRVHLQE